MVRNGFKELHAFMDKYGIAGYSDVFYDRGVTADNFHNLTEKELLAMRLTNTSLLRKILQISGKKENLKYRKMRNMASRQKNGAAAKRSRVRKDDLHSTHNTATSATTADLTTSLSPRDNLSPTNAPTSPMIHHPQTHHQPTANQCVRNATVYIPPSPAKQQKMMDKFKTARGAASAEKKDCCDVPHSHGHQSSNCRVCSELNITQQGVDDREQAKRKDDFKFPASSLQDPSYPNPTYNFALQFRLLQISINASVFQQNTWLEETSEREYVINDIHEYIKNVKQAGREIIIGEETDARKEIDSDERFSFKSMLKETLDISSGIALTALDQSHRELLKEQRKCLFHVENYERDCVAAEEEADMNGLVEISAHLFHMSSKEQKERMKEVENLDYRSRCPMCCKKKCTFFQKPWKLWSTKHQVGKDGEEPIRAHRCSSANLQSLTGGCHGVSSVADYEKMYDFNQKMKRLQTSSQPSRSIKKNKKDKKSMPDMLRSKVTNSDDISNASGAFRATDATSPAFNANNRIPQSPAYRPQPPPQIV